MEVAQIKENEDGSAEFSFDMTDNEAELMFQNGLRALQMPCEDHCFHQYKKARDAVSELGIMDAIVKGVKSAQEGQITSS